MLPQASVIVRVKDEARTLTRTLSSVRHQTIGVELIVVDSGSRDGSLEIARRWSDQVIEIPPGQFTYGLALNLGAAAARAEVHVALSAHCWLPRPDWLALSLAMYERDDVAATNGALVWPDGTTAPAGGVYYQRVEDVVAHLHWGLSNHGSSWRAEAWRQHAFDESLGYAEDKEWALRVMRAGWTLAYAPELWVDMSHTWRCGPREIFRRQRLGHRELGRFAPVSGPTVGELGREWWCDLPVDDHARAAHRFANWRRLTGLAGKYVGRWEAVKLSRDASVSGAVASPETGPSDRSPSDESAAGV